MKKLKFLPKALWALMVSVECLSAHLPFQGRLVNHEGQSIPDGPCMVRFQIFASADATDAVWNGEVHRLTVDNGLVNTILGTTTSLDEVDFSRTLYLEITVGREGATGVSSEDPPLRPRQVLLPLAFAKEAGNSRSLNGFSWSDLVAQAAPGGSTVLARTNSNPAAFLAAGYTPGGSTLLSESWNYIGAPEGVPARLLPSAVWTGKEVIVWGGQSLGKVFNDGYKFNLESRQWSQISTNNAPAARKAGRAVWTGRYMLVWGGESTTGTYLDTGGRYDPRENSWSAIATDGAPSPRTWHFAVWATNRNRLLIFGGYNGASMSDGASYDPDLNRWTRITNAPSARHGWLDAIWTGTEMIVWGGDRSNAGVARDGARYNPSTDQWRNLDLNPTNTPSARSYHTTVWTGREMIVWGGYDGKVSFNDGARYNPASDSWVPVRGSPLSGRYYHNAVWTGTEMIVWGASSLGDGARYNPLSNTWESMASATALGGRSEFQMFWTGSEVIVFGGYQLQLGVLNDLSLYTPPTTMLIYTKR